jgi:MerR family transcriptional regulator, redox-sensitive transcriptional activator SoxR
MQNNISIGDTSKITGVSEKQLRYWENKNILTDIDRVICGARSYRRYSYDQVKFIKKVKERLDRGFTLEASARLAKEEAGEGGEACQD